MCCEDQGQSCIEGMLCGVRNKWMLRISENLSILLGTIGIDAALEFGWEATDTEAIQGWLKEAMVTSGVAAVYATVISTVLRILHYKYGREYEDERTQIDKQRYFHIKNILSQLLSGAFSFGVGILAEYIIALVSAHDVIDEWKANETWAKAIVVPISLATGRALLRFGVFEFVDYVKEKLYGDPLEKETAKLINDEVEDRGYGLKA